MNKIKILHYIPGFHYGGIEARFIDWIRKLDRNKFSFYLLVQTDMESPLIQEFIELGGTVYVLGPNKKGNFVKNFKKLYSLFIENEFHVVHCHSADKSFLVLLLAKIRKVPKRIFHARTSSFSGSSHITIRKILKKITVPLANIKLAVSEEAGFWLFGKTSQFKVLKNSIDLDKFKYNKIERDKVRKEFNIKNNEILIGHIGRFTYAKNHFFLIDVFHEFLKLNSESKLILVGDGPLENDLKRKISELKIEDKVIFSGYRANVSPILSAMDLMLFPSRYEGFPTTLLEAQACSLRCLISDHVTTEIAMTDLIAYKSIKVSPQSWAYEMDNIISVNHDRNKSTSMLSIKNKNYDLQSTVSELEKIYVHGFETKK